MVVSGAISKNGKKREEVDLNKRKKRRALPRGA
jgi:hypothetical protein